MDLDDEFREPIGDLFRIDTGSRERRRGDPRDLEITEPGDAEILRDRDAAPAAGAGDAEGEGVRNTDHEVRVREMLEHEVERPDAIGHRDGRTAERAEARGTEPKRLDGIAITGSPRRTRVPSSSLSPTKVILR